MILILVFLYSHMKCSCIYIYHGINILASVYSRDLSTLDPPPVVRKISIAN